MTFSDLPYRYTQQVSTKLTPPEVKLLTRELNMTRSCSAVGIAPNVPTPREDIFSCSISPTGLLQ